MARTEAEEIAGLRDLLQQERRDHDLTRAALTHARNRRREYEETSNKEVSYQRLAQVKSSMRDFLGALDGGEDLLVQSTLKDMVMRDLERIRA
jgi:hypothetical protein